MEGGGGPPNAAIIGISASRYQWYAPRAAIPPPAPSHRYTRYATARRIASAASGGHSGRWRPGHSRKALFNQVIIRQKDIFRLPAAQGKVVCRPAANPGQGLQLTQPGVNIRRRRQGQLAAERRPGEVDQRLRAAKRHPQRLKRLRSARDRASGVGNKTEPGASASGSPSQPPLWR